MKRLVGRGFSKTSTQEIEAKKFGDTESGNEGWKESFRGEDQESSLLK